VTSGCWVICVEHAALGAADRVYCGAATEDPWPFDAWTPSTPDEP
jgi:hypothetical protein